NSLHISITPIITALGVGGLALALALQPTLSNLFSGIQIIASKQLLPGQYISLENGQEGSVEEITWRYTEIRSLNNNMITIPNSKISEAMITNYHKTDKEIALFVPLRVGFNADLDLVEKTSKETAKKVMQDTVGGAKDFEPLVRFAKFGEAGIEFNVILKVKEFNDQFPVRHAFIKELSKQFREKNIEITYPVRTVYTKTV
ncbi:MAG: mechanosensitive ion channel family protein, partial [Pseudomonadota bacterium]